MCTRGNIKRRRLYCKIATERRARYNERGRFGRYGPGADGEISSGTERPANNNRLIVSRVLRDVCFAFLHDLKRRCLLTECQSVLAGQERG